MALDFLYHRSGPVSFPVSDADVDDAQLFSAFDPVRDALKELLAAAINQELRAAWNVARTGTELDGKEPVEQTWHDHVYPYIARQTVFGFPLLAVYRLSAEHSEYSLAIEQVVSQWAIEYVMPPLSPEDGRRLMGALDAIEKLVPLIVRRGARHPAYASDASQFEANYISKARLLRSERGHWQIGPQGDSGASYPVIQLILETTELERPLDGDAAPFEGVSITIGVGDAKEILPAVISLDTSTQIP